MIVFCVLGKSVPILRTRLVQNFLKEGLKKVHHRVGFCRIVNRVHMRMSSAVSVQACGLYLPVVLSPASLSLVIPSLLSSWVTCNLAVRS
jgi:hypothetical protein